MKKAFSTVEAMLALATFSLIITSLVGGLIYSREATAISGTRNRANFLAEEGLEAVRNMRDADFSLLTDGNHGLQVTGNQWSFNGSSELIDNFFTRQIQVSSVDTDKKQIISQIIYQQNGQRTGLVTLTTYLSNWAKSVPAVKKGGILVFGNGGTTTDAIKYKTFDANTNLWSAAQDTADIDGESTNRALRAGKVYSSTTRNEKVFVSRHYNGSSQYIYAQVYNGINWGNVQLLSSWEGATFLNVQNFDATYLQNGDLMVIYSDNSTTPKFRTWNGASWSAQISSRSIGGIPVYIKAKTRPSTNEVMVVVFDNQNDTNSEYFSGGAYETTSWTIHSEHSTQAPVNTKELIDFSWNTTDTTKGLMVFSNNQNSRSTRYKIFTANGSGGGSWSNITNGANQGNSSTRLGVLRTLTRPNAAEFLHCSQNTLPQVICYQLNTAPTVTSPANQIIAPTTTTTIQRAFDMAYEYLNSSYAINVYSDNTNIPKLKKYNPINNSYDVAATNINTLSSNLMTVRTISQKQTNEIIILLADSSRLLYTIFWDGTNHALYTTSDGLAFTTQANNGSDQLDYWYDYAWDEF